MPTPLALLFLVLAALLGAVAAGVWARLRFARAGTTFRCKVRWQDDHDDRTWATAPRWPRHKARAVWVHDVLLIQQGVVCPRAVVLAARGPREAIRRTAEPEVAGLGSDPVVITLRLDDHRVVDVAARGGDMCALVGPFLAAVIPGLPPAATEPRPRGT